MRRIWHRLIGVALLPLLVRSGLAGTGGWHCADGSLCEPAGAVTCCCGPVGSVSAPDECCPEGTGTGSAAFVGRHCGCYCDAQPLTPIRSTTQALVSLPALPAITITAPEPPGILGQPR